MIVIKKLLIGFQAFVWILRKYRSHKVFLKKQFVPTLEAFFIDNEGSLNSIGYAKVLNYATLVPVFISHNTANLYGKKLTNNELLLQVHLAAITPLVDEFYESRDAKALDNLNSLLRFPSQYQPINSHERFTLFLWKKILENVQSIEDFHQVINQVLDFQNKSKLQQERLTNLELKQLTYGKGGYSLLLFQVTLPFGLNSKTRELFYQIGAEIQLLDDLLDIYEDSRAGIYTLATQANLKQTFVEFKKNHDQIIQKCRELFPHTQTELFLTVIFMLLAPGYVTIHRLNQLLLQSDNETFCPQNYSRSELVTDMEKPKNWLLAIGCYLKLK